MPFLYAVSGGIFGNLLLGARVITVFLGFLTLLGIYFFLRRFQNERSAIFGSLFYLVNPFSLFFDRLALMDSAISAIAIWSLYFTLQFLVMKKIIYAFFLGLIVGIGFWIKTSAYFYLLLPALVFLWNFYKDKSSRSRISSGFSTSLLTAIIVFLPLYINPLFRVHRELMKQYTYPISFIFSFPIPIWIDNFSKSIIWLFFYMSPVLFLLSIISVLLYLKKNKYIFIWFGLPFAYIVLYAKLLTSRHILLLTVPLIIFASVGLNKLFEKKKYLGTLVLVLIIGWSFVYDYYLLFSPQKSPNIFFLSAKSDLKQYFYGYSSGYGIADAVDYLKNEKTKKRKIAVVLRNDHGNPEDALVAFFYSDPDVKIFLLREPLDIAELKKIIAQNTPVYFVSRGAYYAGLEKYLSREVKFHKPNDNEFVGVYEMSSVFE